MIEKILDFAKSNPDVSFPKLCKKFKIEKCKEPTLRNRLKENKVVLKDGRGRPRIEF